MVRSGNDCDRWWRSISDASRQRGVFHTELPTNVLLYGILGTCVWATQWYNPDRAPAPEVIGRHYACMVIGGLTANMLFTRLVIPAASCLPWRVKFRLWIQTWSLLISKP